MKITPTRAVWIGRLGSWIIRALGSTLRERQPPLPQKNAIYAVMHGQLLLSTYLYRGNRVAVMISRHGDGELIAQIAERLGFKAARGSSSRNGAKASLEMVRSCADRPWAITPDGPRGPRGSVAPGVVWLAARGGRPIVPVGVAASRAKYCRSWDRFAVPWPFAKVTAVFGDPIEIPAEDMDEATLNSLYAKLGQQLRQMTHEAEEQVKAKGTPEPPPASPNPEDG